MQVHVPYTVYAHFFLMREVLLGAGVKKVEYSMDCESLLRGAFLSAWCDEVKQGNSPRFLRKACEVPDRDGAGGGKKGSQDTDESVSGHSAGRNNGARPRC